MLKVWVSESVAVPCTLAYMIATMWGSLVTALIEWLDTIITILNNNIDNE